MTNQELIKQVPHDVLCRFRKIYDSFTVKDMPFADFVCELMELSDENKMQDDLEEIIARKQMFAANKTAIERAGG